MKSLVELHLTVVEDLGDLLGVDTQRDRVTILSRWQAEGDSFLTITLPEFEKGLMASIEQGSYAPSMTPGFRCHRGIPVFLRGFLVRIFAADGKVRDLVDPEALRAVRQICLLVNKIKRPPTDGRLAYAVKAYEDTDKEVLEELPPEANRLRGFFQNLFVDVLDGLENAISSFSLIPRHGPGAVVEHLSNREKWEKPTWFESVESVFPSRMFLSWNFQERCNSLVSPECEPPVRVVFVPKTMKTPRVIAIEPACRQYVQQAVSRELYMLLRRHFPDCLDLHDQGTNRAFAWWASGTGSRSTIDLSEASDRLSWSLVRFLFSGYPHITDALDACRSRQAKLPDGRVIDLKKFASMGSALTFPIESMVFYAIALLGSEGSCHGADGLPPVSVFGDDIIAPADKTPAVCDLLQTFGLKVNRRKTFVRSKFRESCGAEFWDTHDVSIVRVREDLPASRQDAKRVASTVAFRNFCYCRGFWKTCQWLDDLLETVLHRQYRAAPVDHPSISRWTHLQVQPDGVSRRYQYPVYRRLGIQPLGLSAEPDGDGGLLKWFLQKEGPARATSMFEAQERPASLTLKSRWYAA